MSKTDNRVEIISIDELIKDEFYVIDNKGKNRSYIVQFTGIESTLVGPCARFNVLSSTNEDILVGSNIRLNFNYNKKDQRSVYKI